MESEIKELLEKDLVLDEENNKLLKSMLFSQRLSWAMSILKWIIIIASILGITYWFGPVIEKLLLTYNKLIS